MRSATPQAATQSEDFAEAALVRLSLPDRTVRLVDAAASVRLGSETFSGADPVYGALVGLEALRETFDQSAPEVRLTLAPPTTSACMALCAPQAQGSQVLIWVGVAQISTGQFVTEAELQFLGEFDAATWSESDQGRSCEITVVSAAEYFFTEEEAARLTPEFHKARFPGETGLDQNIDALSEPYWGKHNPSVRAVTIKQVLSGSVRRGQAGGLGAA